jgi:hypothetical protein
MVKRKREEKETELKEKFDNSKGIQIRKNSLEKIGKNYLIKLPDKKDEGFIDEIVQKYNYNTLTINFNFIDTKFLSKIPSQITRLRLMSYFNIPIDNIPDTVKYLEISSWFNCKINKLPSNLTHLEIGDTYEDIKKIDSFPNSLVYLKIPKYPHDLNNLPSGLKQLVIGKTTSVSNLPNHLTHITINSDVQIEDLPETLEYLNLGGDFNKSIENLPRNLKRLTLGNKFNQSLVGLPNSLEELEITGDFNQPIHNIPENLKVLKLGNSFNSPIFSCNNKLEYIYFGFGYELDLDMLPFSIQTIEKNTTSFTAVGHLHNKKNKVFKSCVPIDKFSNLKVCFNYMNYEYYNFNVKIDDQIHNIQINPVIEIGPSGYRFQTHMEKYKEIFETSNYILKVSGSSIGMKYKLEFRKIFKK